MKMYIKSFISKSQALLLTYLDCNAYGYYALCTDSIRFQISNGSIRLKAIFSRPNPKALDYSNPVLSKCDLIMSVGVDGMDKTPSVLPMILTSKHLLWTQMKDVYIHAVQLKNT